MKGIPPSLQSPKAIRAWCHARARFGGKRAGMKLPRDVRLVSYHGSVTAHHGPAWMVAECACSRFYPGMDERTLRAVLVTRNGELLMDVRRESFTYVQSFAQQVPEED